jgi:tetratricopeptide (TPR) repeat protein
MFAVLRASGAEASLERLEAGRIGRMPPALGDLMRCILLFTLNRRDEAEVIRERLADPHTEMELFLHAMLNRDRDLNSGTEVLEYVERAVLAADRPHLWLHMHWAVFADGARDAASCRRCAANLQLNWPEEPVAVYFTCLALRGVQPEAALKVVDTALAAHPDLGLLHCARGMVLRGRGDMPAAIASFERAIALSPSIGFLQYSLGAARYDAEDYAGAITAFAAARDLAPRMVDAWVGLGMALRHAGRGQEALAALLQAKSLQPSNSTVRFQLGQTLMQVDRIGEGVQELREAVTQSPKDANKWHHLSSALFRIGDQQGAIASLRFAVQKAPDVERAHQMLMMGLRFVGRGDEARAAIVEWTTALPRSLEAWLQLGLDCVDPEQPDRRDAASAIWAARRALELSEENNAVAWYVRGEAEALLGHADVARTALARSLDITPGALQEPQRSRCDELLRELGGRLPAGR